MINHYTIYSSVAAAILCVALLLVLPGARAFAEEALTETGDASSTGTVENVVNTNEVTTDGAATTIDNDSSAETELDMAVDAGTGENAVQAEESASVETGDAYATGSAINVVNTNIIDAEGMIEFEDFFNALGIDLRSLDLSYFFDSTACVSCAPLTVSNTNAATSTADLSVLAATGGNHATSTEGTADVTTGNAYASGNLVNFINANIVRSNYLLVSVNNFGNLLGDITLPNADFFKQLFAAGGGVTAGTTATTTNVATLDTNSAIGAETGSNAAEGGDAEITTGDAYASNTTINQVNTNLIGGTSIFFLFRIWGDWSGNVHGLPDGMTWRETPGGIMLMSEPSGRGDHASSTDCCEQVAVENTNTAALANNVQVFALTGDNHATGDERASVHTGNAYASANTVNIVNTNIIGHNWLFAIFNIFGDFSGNISFGRPDLWVGASAESPNPTTPGSDIIFHHTIANTGDADASNVSLAMEYEKALLTFDSGEDSGAGREWYLGTLRKGETRELTTVARVRDFARGSVAVPVHIVVRSNETDEDAGDNNDQLALVIASPNPPVSGSGGEPFTSDATLTLTKTASVSSGRVPSTVNYTLVVTNDGGPAHDVVVTDTLTGPSGNVVGVKKWNLGDIAHNEEVRISYTAEFGGALLPGEYRNTGSLTGIQNYRNKRFASPVSAKSSTVVYTVLPVEVAQAKTEPTPLCQAYLTSYLGTGDNNSMSEVTKLQTFLRSEGHGSLAITGRYDPATRAAVTRFQEEHREQILSPWGFTQGTGEVYYTTQKVINDIYCSGTRTFGLTKKQQDEIKAIRARVSVR